MRHFTRAQLDRAFEAQSIAVIGAKKSGNYFWLRRFQTFPGKLYSVHVNPESAREIEALGISSHSSILEVPRPDYVMVNTARRHAVDTFAQCIKAGAGAVAFFTSGFAETDAEGARMQETLARMSRESGVPLFGPNCLGIYNPARGMEIMANMPLGEAGPVGMVGQSGTHSAYFAKALWSWHGLRCARAISFGNAAALDAADWIEYLGQDERVKVLAAYIEGVGDKEVSDYQRFAAAVRAVAAKKPVVIWKGGDSVDGGRVTTAHTGVRPVPPQEWAALLADTGAIGVNSMEALVDTVAVLVKLPPATQPRGPRAGVVVLTGGQGPAVTDALGRHGLRVPALSQASHDELAAFFDPIGGGFHNPLDAAYAMETPAMLARELDILDRDPNIDFVVMDFFQTIMSPRRLQSGYGVGKEHLQHEQAAVSFLDVLAAHAARATKPFFTIVSPATAEREGLELRELLTRRGLLAIPGAERAATAYANGLAHWARAAPGRGAA
jgi:acyl-CoA synthetase (NDP forming)